MHEQVTPVSKLASALRPTGLKIVAVLAGSLLAQPVVHAFTIQDGTGVGPVPKFDLEEQSRNFRKGDLTTPGTGKGEWETPVGKLQFGVQSNPRFGAGSGAADRRHFDRMLAPPNMRERYD